MSKETRTRCMRYKRPALASLGAEVVVSELEEIIEECDNIRYWVDQEDDETLLNALDGDEEEEWEFKVAFADLSAKAEELQTCLWEIGFEDFYRDFDDCTVALIGNRYKMVGYDAEEDYVALTSYESGFAEAEAGKRLMRRTKPDIIATIGQCFGIALAFIDLRQSYDYLKATFDILRDDNTSLLRLVKEIEGAYGDAAEDNFRTGELSVKKYDALLDALPQRAWVE